MRKLIMIAAVALLALPIDSNACGDRRIKKDLKVSLMPSKMVLLEKNGVVDLLYKVVVPANYVHSKHQYIFTPVLTDYTNATPMPSIVINGKKYLKVMERNSHSKEMKEMLKSQPDLSNAIVLPASKNPRIIEYVYATPFMPWMEKADLVLVQRFNSKKNTVLIDEDVYGSGVTCTTPKKNIVESTNTTEIINKMEGKINIAFPVSSSKIDMTFDANIRELYNLKMLIKNVMDNKDVIIDSIVIVASSSPEGPYEYNAKLSQARASAIKTYLENEFGITNQAVSKFKTRTIAENWQGLKNLVQESNLNNKPQIMKALDIENLDQREKAMLLLPQYSAIKKYILPQLRYVKYEIFYHDVNKTVVINTQNTCVDQHKMHNKPVVKEKQHVEIRENKNHLKVKEADRLYREDHYRKTGSMRMEDKVKVKRDKVKAKVKEKPSGDTIHQERYQKR